MLKKFLFSGTVIILTLLISSSAFAADVYTTHRGKHYHLAGCIRIKSKKTAVLDEQQAKMRGLKPCPVCYETKDVRIKAKAHDNTKK